MSKQSKIRTLVTCKETVHYSTYVDLTPEEFDILNNCIQPQKSGKNKTNAQAYELLERILDRHDVIDNDGYFMDLEVEEKER